MRWILTALGAIAAGALLAWGIPLAVDAADALSATRLGETRTPVPGALGVKLESGKHTVFYEVDEDGSIEVPRLAIDIRAEGDGAPLELDGFSGDLDLTSGGRHATAIGTVRVPQERRYRIRVTSRVDAESPAVVLGRPITARVVRLLVAIAAIVAGLGMAALVAIAIALRARGAAV